MLTNTTIQALGVDELDVASLLPVFLPNSTAPLYFANCSAPPLQGQDGDAYCTALLGHDRSQCYTAMHVPGVADPINACGCSHFFGFRTVVRGDEGVCDTAVNRNTALCLFGAVRGCAGKSAQSWVQIGTGALALLCTLVLLAYALVLVVRLCGMGRGERANFLGANRTAAQSKSLSQGSTDNCCTRCCAKLNAAISTLLVVVVFLVALALFAINFIVAPSTGSVKYDTNVFRPVVVPVVSTAITVMLLNVRGRAGAGAQGWEWGWDGWRELAERSWGRRGRLGRGVVR